MKIVKEIWRPVVGYECLYKVSNKGGVKSIDRYENNAHKNGLRFRKGKILKQMTNKKGYPYVHLCMGSKSVSKRIHRLVAEAFLPNPNNYPIVNHKDENKQNNCVENLEWCNNRYNCNYGTSINRMLKTKKERGIIKYPELQGLAHKDHKEYMRRYREIKQREQAA